MRRRFIRVRFIVSDGLHQADVAAERSAGTRGPTPHVQPVATSRRLRLTASLVLAAVVLLQATLVAADDHDEDEDEDQGRDGPLEDLAEGAGSVAAWLLGLSVVIIPWKLGYAWLRKEGLVKLGFPDREHRQMLTKGNRWFMRIHQWIGWGALVLGLTHGLFIDEQHWMLWLGLAGMGAMSIAGALMTWKWPPRSVKKGARIVHVQRVLLVATIALLLIGHQLVD